jgi:L-lactate dehydrogenase complex protein LldG
MATSSSKELILGRIRKALSVPTEVPFSRNETEAPLFPTPQEDLAVMFASEFSRLQGLFAYCENEADLVRQVLELMEEKGWKNPHCPEQPFRALFSRHGSAIFENDSDVAGCDVAVTGCEVLVARTGSIVLSAAQPEGRTTSVYTPVHICIAFTSQLVYEIQDALVLLQERYRGRLPSLITFATGPSRTADIEKTLVVGVHGPGQVFCFLVDG